MQLLEWIKECGAAEALVCELITHIPVQSFTTCDQIEGMYQMLCVYVCECVHVCIYLCMCVCVCNCVCVHLFACILWLSDNENNTITIVKWCYL